MTARDACLQLLRDQGLRSLDPALEANNLNGRPIGTGDQSAIAGYLTGAFEEIWNDGPAFISQRPYGGVLRPQTALMITTTQYSATMSAVTTWAAWMIGCTVRVGDDPYDNRFINQTTLARPYMGTTGVAVASNVWGDCMALPTDTIAHLISPVHLVGYGDIEIVGTREEFERYTISPTWTPNATGASTSYNKRTGQPCHGFVDTITANNIAGMPKYLRVTPMPDIAVAVEFLAKTVPPIIGTADFDNGDHTTDPLVVLPLDWQQSVLVAIARQRATSDPLFVNQDGRQEIFRQFEIARAILKTTPPGISVRTIEYN